MKPILKKPSTKASLIMFNLLILVNKFYNRHLVKRVMYGHLILLVILVQTVTSCSDDSSDGGGSDPSSSSLALPSSSSSVLLSSSSLAASSSSSEELSSSSEILSSSSETLSSSSSVLSSSSSSLTASSSSVNLCAGFVDGSMKMHYGRNKQHFCDKRDGKIYPYVEIDGQIWMAQNMNYRTMMESSITTPDYLLQDNMVDAGGCYANITSNCEKGGRLYHYHRNSAGAACPEGWRLPTQVEWEKLIAAAGGTANAGRNLKAREGWKACGPSDDDETTYDCNDSLGFAAIPTGVATNTAPLQPMTTFSGLNDNTGWFGEYSGSSTGYRILLTRTAAGVSTSTGVTDLNLYSYPVRCVNKNTEAPQ
jgi:uncharacterized protein (TIGR02145 family)